MNSLVGVDIGAIWSWDGILRCLGKMLLLLRAFHPYFAMVWRQVLMLARGS